MKSHRLLVRALYACTTVICLYILVPIVMIVMTSFSADTYITFPPKEWSLEWYEKLGTQDQFLRAFVNSLIASTGATLLALVSGTLAALAIIRYPFPGSGLLRSFLMSPLVVPKITLGVAYLILFSKMKINGGLFALVLGEAVTVFPFILSIVGSTLAQVKISYEEAASDLGARPVRVFFTITLPQIKLSLILSAALAFMLTFDQLETALFILRQHSYTLPIQLFLYMEKWQDPTIAVVSVLLVAFAVLVFIVLRLLLKAAPGGFDRLFGGKK